MKLLPRFTVNRPDWLLIVGPDLSNPHYGVSLHKGLIAPIGDWKRWRFNLRINIRSPITFHLRRSRGVKWFPIRAPR